MKSICAGGAQLTIIRPRCKRMIRIGPHAHRVVALSQQKCQTLQAQWPSLSSMPAALTGEVKMIQMISRSAASRKYGTRLTLIGNVAAPSQAPPEAHDARAGQKASIRASRRIAAALVLRDDDKP